MEARGMARWFALLSLAWGGTVGWASVPEDPPVSSAAAQSQWKHIGIKAVVDAPCPDPGAPWAVRHLFGVNAVDWATVPARLRPFCNYELLSPGAATPAHLSSLTTLPLSRLEPDAMALTLQGDGLVEALREPLEARFQDQAGAGPLLPVSPRQATRLGILDTSPDPGMNPGSEPETSRHGATLQELARSLVCPDQGLCLADVTPRLTLAYTSFDPWDRQSSRRDLVRGGHLGLLGDLAEALFLEVLSWRDEASLRPLVLNLSIGWDGALFGGLEADVTLMSPVIQAIYQALEHAACEGALVIAAAGNFEALRELSPGPLLPAAWERRPRSCRAIGSTYQPLLFAAAGVHMDGAPLINARPASSPPLAAYGDHAVTAAGPGQASAVLTGSSVASLVVAASAAALWHHVSDQDGPGIMDLLHSSGDTLLQPVDFACVSELGGGCPVSPTSRSEEVRRVSICSALTGGCESAVCQQILCPAWTPSSNGSTPSDDGAYRTLSALGLTEKLTPEPVCAGFEPLYDPGFGEPPDPCPGLQFNGARSVPWLHPQPGMDPCPVCIFESSKQSLTVEIAEDYPEGLSSPTLEACGTSYSFNEVESALSAGDRIRIEDLDLKGCTRATLSFAKSGGGSASSPLLISK